MEMTARAELAVAAAGRDASDYARAIAGEVTTPMPPTARIRDARQLRILALAVLDRAVILELLSGTSWEEVAEALMLPVGETIRRYGPTVEKWRTGVDSTDVQIGYGDLTTGTLHDPDAPGTALTLDQWIERHEAWKAKHREPWEEPGPSLASRFV